MVPRRSYLHNSQLRALWGKLKPKKAYFLTFVFLWYWLFCTSQHTTLQKVFLPSPNITQYLLTLPVIVYVIVLRTNEDALLPCSTLLLLLFSLKHGCLLPAKSLNSWDHIGKISMWSPPMFWPCHHSVRKFLKTAAGYTIRSTHIKAQGMLLLII